VADRTCPLCWTPFTVPGQRKKIYCSDNCRRAAYERRKQDLHSRPAGADSPRPPQSVAERDCPHCGKPVVIVALLTTSQAARTDPSLTPGNVLTLRSPLP
jgi:endogenous inhibitor of DNA gyrase (YacG/DUF329 family)